MSIRQQNLYNLGYTNAKVCKDNEIERKHQIKKKENEFLYLLHYHIVYFMMNVYILLGRMYCTTRMYVISIFTENSESYHLMQTNIGYGTGTVKLNMLLYVTYPRYHSSRSSLAESINSFFAIKMKANLIYVIKEH